MGYYSYTFTSFFLLIPKIAFWHHKTKISYYSHTFMASFIIVPKTTLENLMEICDYFYLLLFICKQAKHNISLYDLGLSGENCKKTHKLFLKIDLLSTYYVFINILPELTDLSELKSIDLTVAYLARVL